MSPAGWSLIAFLAAIALSWTSPINVGVIAHALAWGLGSRVAGLKPEAIAAGFPAMLLLTLVGVTLLFAIAEQNLMIWGLSMTLVGALLCQLAAGPLSRL